MSAEETIESRPKKKTRTRIFRWAAALVVMVIALAVLAVPWFVSSEKGREMILARINRSIDGKMDFTGLTMGWWSGVRITGLGFNDNAGRISVRVKQISTKPHYGSILIGGLSLGETEILEPRVEVNLARTQTQKPQHPKNQKEENQQAVALPVKSVKMVVKDGDLKVTDAKAETVELAQIGAKLNLEPPGGQTDFDANLAVIGGVKESKISANGRVVPGRGWKWEGTSGEVTVEVNDLELGSLSPIFEMAGIDIRAAGKVSGNAEGEIRNGQIENVTAKITGSNLDVNAVKIMGGRIKTSQLGVDVKLARAKDMINIETFDIKSDWLTADGRGAIPTTIDSLDEFLKMNLSGHFDIGMAQLFAQMPGMFGLKEGTSVTSGVLSGDIATLMEEGKRKIKGQVNLERLAGMVDGKSIALSEPVRAEAEITSEKNGIKFDKLELTSAFAKINCRGTTESFKYSGDADLAKFQAELGQFVDTRGYGIAGELSGRGEVAIKADKISAAGSSSVKNFRISSAGGVSASELAAEIDFSVAVERSKEVLDVNFVKAKASLGEVNIKDAVLPLGKEGKGEVNLDVSAKSVDLQKVQPFAVLLAGFPKEMQLSGILGGQAAVRSKKDRYYITAEGTRIENLEVNYPGKTPFEQKEVSAVFDAEADSAGKIVIVKKFQVDSDQIKIRGQFSKTDEGQRTKLESKADCEYDWAAVSTIAAPILPKGLVLKGKRKDTITFSSQWPTNDPNKMLANMSGSAKLGFDSAEYMGLQIGAAEIVANIDKGKLTIPPFSTTANNGTLNFGANADFNQSPVLLTIPQPMNIVKDVQLNDRMAAALLKNINPIFANSRDAQGVANLECRELAIPLSGGSENDTRIDATVSIKNLKLQSPLLEVLSVALKRNLSGGMALRPSQFVMKQGVLSYDKMQVDVGDMSLIFAGKMGPGNKMKVTMTLPGVGGIALKGTKDKPEIDAAKMAQLILQQQLLNSGSGSQPQDANQAQSVDDLIDKALEKPKKKKK